MPLEWFKCLDGEVVKVKDCLKECRMKVDCPVCGGDARGIPTLSEPDGAEAGCTHCNGTGKVGERCLTLPTLTLIAEQRVWNGIPSTTQLLNGTMMEFLKLTQPYVIDPDKMAFALLGSRHHKNLQEVAKQLNLPAEVALTTDDRDIFDLLEPEGNAWTLTDYKTWGSYKVAKSLGIVKVGMQDDPSGEVYKTTSKWGKKGEPKQVPVFQVMAQEADMWETELQLNRYRVMLEERGIAVGRMQVQVTVRDGGLAVAKSRGITRNTFKIPVRKLDDKKVVDYFFAKQEELLDCLDKGKCNNPCDDRECWEGVRCKEYCDVARYCAKGVLHQEG